jgi:hypothetical protein
MQNNFVLCFVFAQYRGKLERVAAVTGVTSSSKKFISKESRYMKFSRQLTENARLPVSRAKLTVSINMYKDGL